MAIMASAFFLVSLQVITGKRKKIAIKTPVVSEQIAMTAPVLSESEKAQLALGYCS